jgi:hypothetical protein
VRCQLRSGGQKSARLSESIESLHTSSNQEDQSGMDSQDQRLPLLSALCTFRIIQFPINGTMEISRWNRETRYQCPMAVCKR